MKCQWLKISSVFKQWKKTKRNEQTLDEQRKNFNVLEQWSLLFSSSSKYSNVFLFSNFDWFTFHSFYFRRTRSSRRSEQQNFDSFFFFMYNVRVRQCSQCFSISSTFVTKNNANENELVINKFLSISKKCAKDRTSSRERKREKKSIKLSNYGCTAQKITSKWTSTMLNHL